MTDKELEDIQTVNVNVTPESVDLHVEIIRDNGYTIMKNYSLYTRYVAILLLGMWIMGMVLNGSN
jgi:hypothetical protein|tara:strand:- start:748 stop:942 length:195 start_codon:yes stop_codon:yes gene_type:complete